MSFALFLSLWIAGAIMVGRMAARRVRSPIGWFALALVISPLAAGVLLARAGWYRGHAWAVLHDDKQGHSVARLGLFGRRTTTPGLGATLARHFEAEGAYAGIPYRTLPGGAIDAMMPGGVVRFRSIELFTAAADGRNSHTNITG